MKKWIIYGVLLCSVAFNVIFITKACQYRRNFPQARPPKIEPQKWDSFRKFMDCKREDMRHSWRKSNNSKDKIINKILEGNLSSAELKVLEDSLIKITVDRERKFIGYLIEYKTQGKGKKRSKK